ncbi:MAG: aminomethyl-transferring glycine dehydrogenase subunit GcvPB [Acidobacteria bacterium]|nr:aminomethyl-transferring glycine dehydrogenase subunit GcvPB [Acidobacteriota bacterium]MBI3663658.1 aminomethyl-transferring glycine dehydrogenase subunit GcvPB [Acidobacteriota bacterium]
MSENIAKAGRHVNQSEGLIFEKSSPGKRGMELPPLDVPAVDAAKALGAEYVREGVEGFPEVSEIEVVRHFTRISTWNYAIDYGMYPLGSCTMKYNPRVNEFVARLEGIATEHPYQPVELSQGCLRVLKTLENILAEVTGMDAVTLQPAAGAQGELTGLLLIRAYLESKGNPRKKVLIPDSAHGTNPATAVIAGYAVENIKSDANGEIDAARLVETVNEDVAALMVTNPNTLGIFEQNISEIAEILHARGALLYMDGANMNALAGIARPGDFGVDVMHLNLHKTFSTPHGGGGPGAGPVAVKKILEPFLPTPVVVEKDGKFALDHNRPKTIGRVKAFYGNFGVLVRALAYALAYGPGMRQASEDAVLNANYIRKALEDVYELPYKLPCMHEVVFSDARQKKNGVNTMDIAKRLIDYGFHPYTTAFPLIVPGALMIEPTESECKEECDQFIDAMRSIAEEAATNPELVKTAPHTTRVGRLDEVTAARKPILRWKPGQ